MMAAEVSEVGGVGGAAVVPVVGVVDVCVESGAGAAGEPAGVITVLKIAAEVRGYSVGVAPDGENCSGFGMSQQTREGRCVRGEASGGVGVDGPMAVEGRGCVGVSEEGENGDGH